MNKDFMDTTLLLWSQVGGLVTATLRIVLIVILAWGLIFLLKRIIRTFNNRIAARFDDPEMIKRAETLGRVFRYLALVVVSVIAGMLILGELGISVAPILGAAGVVGLAVGFGAQSLVKDYFTGLFILLENQIREGDVVKLGEHAGFVEVVTLRYVQLRDYDGNVHFVPNSQIDTVVNFARGFSQSVIDVRVAYRENTDEVMEIMREAGRKMREDPVFSLLILEDLEMAGVDRWTDSAVIIRCRFKVKPLEQWSVRREFLRRLKHLFDAHGIEIPFPHITVYAGEDKQGKSTALPLRLLRTKAARCPAG